MFHPDDLPIAVAGYSAAMSSGEDLCVQYRLQRNDGYNISFSICPEPILVLTVNGSGTRREAL